MNIQRGMPDKVQGRHCDHVFISVKGEYIRSARRERPDRDVNGNVLKATCIVPRCQGRA